MVFGIKGFLQRIGGFISGGTSGSILYIDSSGNLAQDNSNLFYDATNKRIGLNVNTPTATLDIKGSGGTTVAYAAFTVNTSFVDIGTAASSAQFGANVGAGDAVLKATGKLFFLNGSAGNEMARITTGPQMSIGGAAPGAAIILDLPSTTQAFRPPVMTTTQKNAISGLTGMVVYDSTLNKLSIFTGAAWETVTSV